MILNYKCVRESWGNGSWLYRPNYMNNGHFTYEYNI